MPSLPMSSRTLNTKEYYVLENRRADGLFYPTKMGSGMLVTHVYFDYNKFEANALNNDPPCPATTSFPQMESGRTA